MTALNPKTHTVTLDVTAPDAFFALTEALREWSWRQRGEARDELADDPQDTTAANRLRWAGQAEAMLERIDAGDGTTPGQPGLSADTRAVIDAVIEALDIPHAATVGHEETRDKILAERLRATLVTLQLIAETADCDADRLGARLEYLREKLAEHPPVGYVTHGQARERLKAGASWPAAELTQITDRIAACFDESADKHTADRQLTLEEVERCLFALMERIEENAE